MESCGSAKTINDLGEGKPSASVKDEAISSLAIYFGDKHFTIARMSSSVSVNICARTVGLALLAPFIEIDPEESLAASIAMLPPPAMIRLGNEGAGGTAAPSSQPGDA